MAQTPPIASSADPSILRQVERQTAIEQELSGQARTVAGQTIVYGSATAAVAENTITVTQSPTNDSGDVVTVYTSPSSIQVTAVDQVINQYTSTDSGVSQIVAGTGISISSTGASGTGVVTISSDANLGNIVSVNLDGNVNNVLRGDGTWAADANSSYGNGNVVSLLASFGSNTITTTGNVSVGNISATNLGNVSAVNLDGNASNVLRGDGSFGPDANSSYGDSNVVSLLGSFGSNTITTTGLITGNGAGLTNLAGANVSGFVANANVANTAYAVAAANVSGLGNVALINLDGNSSNVLRGDGTFSADANSSYGDSNVVSLLGSFGSNTITTTGNVSVGNISATNLGNISSINLDGSNSNVLYGNGAFAAVPATAPAGSNGEIQFNISGAFASTGNLTFVDGVSGGTLEIGPPGAMQLDGNGTVVASNLSSSGNVYVSAGNGVVDLRATGNVVLKSDNANYEWVFDSNGDLTAPGDINLNGDITGNGTLTLQSANNGNSYVNLDDAGDSSFGSFGNVSILTDGDNREWVFDTTGTLTAPGDITVGGDITGKASANTLVLKAQPTTNTSIQLNSIVDSTIQTHANLEIVTDSSNTSQSWTFDTAGNLTLPGNTLAINFANGSSAFGNIVSVNLDGNSSNVLRGDGTFSADANSSYGDSNVVSLLSSFGSNTITTTGNISAGNVSATDVSGTTLGGTLTTAAQPNVTSVGTLSSLTVSGNSDVSTVNFNANVIANIATWAIQSLDTNDKIIVANTGVAIANALTIPTSLTQSGGDPVAATDTTIAFKIPITINGNVYYIALTAAQ